MALHENFFGRGFLNRASWKREDVAYLTESCQSDKARFIILNEVSNPLVKAGNSSSIKDVLAHKIEGDLKLATLSWNDVSSFFKASGDKGAIFQSEPSEALDKNPLLVFLGVDERPPPSQSDGGGAGAGAGAAATNAVEADEKTQRSLPDAGIQPRGEPYFVIDCAQHKELADKAMELHGGEKESMFIDLRAEVLCLDFESTGVVAEARALVDWNKRNRFCPGCGNATASVWGGWKRACLPDQPSSGSDRPPCVSKKGVHNFAYPRTDPVVIMAVQNASKDKLLLGRQKAWPKGFFSCLAGFVEPGESIEESVKREVWEEAGIRVKEVKYHSSQPWPFPGSLMIGCLATAEEGTEIRTDLDNELESADFYPLSTVKAALSISLRTGISRQDVEQIQNASDNAEQLHSQLKERETKAKMADKEKPDIRVPPKTAIAHTLIRAWAEENDKEAKL